MYFSVILLLLSSFSSLFLGIALAIRSDCGYSEADYGAFSSLFLGIALAIQGIVYIAVSHRSFSSLFLGIALAMSESTLRRPQKIRLSVPFSSG